jgi:hypothetical protein
MKHLIVILKISIMWIIPDESASISAARLKYKYDSKEALKREESVFIFILLNFSLKFE